jgi:hypothetical protein
MISQNFAPYAHGRIHPGETGLSTEGWVESLGA